MGNTSILANPKVLLDSKVMGLRVSQWLDSNESCAWYVAEEDAGEKSILYVYEDAAVRDKNRTCTSGFRTCSDEVVVLGGQEARLPVIRGEYCLMMNRETREHLLSLAAQNLLKVDQYRADQVLGRGRKGITFLARREGPLRTSYALKLTPSLEYEGRSYLPEAARMVELAARDRDHFPSVHGCGTCRLTTPAGDQEFVYFVEDFFHGKTLFDFLETEADKVTVAFLEDFIRQMLIALRGLKALDLMHDDLHARNVFIHEFSGGSRPVIIDLGSAKPRGSTKKARDDIRNFASHVASIMNLVARASQPTVPAEDTVLEAAKALHAKISDDDPMRRPDDIGEIEDHFTRHFPQAACKQHLIRPFDFGNAEEVVDNGLLQRLAAKSFPWWDKLESSANVLIIGPRGSGKTTVFRSMSFTSLALAGKIDQALGRPYVGLYISCNKEFRLRFSALDGAVLHRREAEVRHYFNLLVLREFLGSIRCCLEAGRAGGQEVRAVRDFLREHLRFSSPLGPEPATLLQEAEGFVGRKIGEARMAIWFNHDCAVLTQQGLVADLASLLTERISVFQGKTLYLLVDDYTERKVPTEAQRALNHILFVPNAAYRSKLSSEVFGVATDQTFGAFLDQDRDYKEYNLGTLYYAELPTSEQMKFRVCSRICG